MSSYYSPERARAARYERDQAMDDYEETIVEGNRIRQRNMDDILAEENNPKLKVRAFVQGGGCAGFQYDMAFDNTSMDGDLVSTFDGVSVVVDRMSAPHITGATIDWVSTLQSSHAFSSSPSSMDRSGNRSARSA